MSEEPNDSDRSDREQDRPPADRQSGGQPQGGQPPNQPQGGQPQGGQPPNQPQGGQPPNQPQGGQPPNQPQAGQPQGGQPQGQPRGQPQGGQPQGQPRGQPQRQPQSSQFQTDLDIETNYLKEWAIYFTALFAVGGVGLGVLWILFDAIDESIFEVSNLGGVGSALGATSIVVTMLMILAVAGVFIGAWFGQKLNEPDRESFVIAGGSVAAGAAAFFFIVSLLLSVGLDGLSLNFGGVIINLILTTIFVGATAAGGAAVTRNLAPRDL
jgi:hypothetical protein